MPETDFAKIGSRKMLLRLVIATHDGVSLDRDDILIARLGHSRGVRLFQAVGDACSEHYQNCALEWRAADCTVGDITAKEMLVQQSEDGILAVACLLHSGDRKYGGAALLLEEEVGITDGIPVASGDEIAEPKSPRKWRFRDIFFKQRREQRIFSVFRDWPADFRPIR